MSLGSVGGQCYFTERNRSSIGVQELAKCRTMLQRADTEAQGTSPYPDILEKKRFLFILKKNNFEGE